MSIAERLGGVEGIALGHANLAALLDRVGPTEASLEAARDGFAIAQRLGVPRTYGGVLLGHVAKALFDLGRWDEAAAAADEGLELDPVGRSAAWLHLNRARVDTNQGRFDAAEERLRLARETRRGGRPRRDLPGGAAWRRSRNWRPGRADCPTVRAAVAEALASLVDADLPLDPALAWLAWHALRAEADAAERRGRARTRLPCERSRRTSSPSPRLLRLGDRRRDDRSVAGRPSPVCVASSWTRIGGRPDPAALRRTANEWDELGRPAPAAYARFRAAEAILATDGDRAEAAAALREAHATAATPRRGAPSPRDRAAGPPRPHRPGRRSGRDRGRGGPDDRSASPIENARSSRLVAAGRSNQQIADALFITRKTASVHVSNILGKLGVANRVEAAAVAHRLGLAGEPDHPADP